MITTALKKKPLFISASIIAIPLSFLLSACVSSPPLVQTNRAIIPDQPSDHSKPREIDVALDAAIIGDVVQHEGGSYQVTATYYSALGQECKLMLPEDHNPNNPHIIVCNEDGLWYLAANILRTGQ